MATHTFKWNWFLTDDFAASNGTVTKSQTAIHASDTIMSPFGCQKLNVNLEIKRRQHVLCSKCHKISLCLLSNKTTCLLFQVLKFQNPLKDDVWDKLSLLRLSQLDWIKIITWLSTRRKKMSFLRKILFSQIRVDRSVYRNNYLNKLDPQFLIIKEENLFVFV